MMCLFGVDALSQTTFSDLVQIPPYEFYKKNRDEIEDKLNEKYANKVSIADDGPSESSS